MINPADLSTTTPFKMIEFLKISRLGSPIKGRVKRKNTSPAEKHTCFSFTLQLLSVTSLSC